MFMENYAKIKIEDDFFNVLDTLSCGQVFRYKKYEQGFLVFSLDKCAYCYNFNGKAIIECKEKDKSYFERYFDLKKDYFEIYNFAKNCGYDFISSCAELGKGIRILKQDKFETLLSFIISQNNNIPRIQGIIEKLCLLGEKKKFMDHEYYAFPSVEKLSEQNLDYFYSIGLGYRARYIKELVNIPNLTQKLESLNFLETNSLKRELLKIYGVGPKVADCVVFFGFSKTDSFPVDTWIEKVYKQDFNGNVVNRNKISDWFVCKFKSYSGYIQQYLFHYKRNKEKN